MADERLIFRLEAENNQLLKKLDQSQKKINGLEQTAGKSINAISNDFRRLQTNGARSLNKFGKAANDSMGNARRAVGQLGFQVQDIAVQLQGGQNPLLILSQQGSQVASVFGPAGAVVGAFVAVGSILVSVMNPSIKDAADRLFDLKSSAMKLEEGLAALGERVSLNSDGTLEYTKRIQDLAKVSKDAAKVELSIALIQAQANIKTATAGIVASVTEIEDKFKALDNLGGGMKRGGEKRLERLRNELGLTASQAREFREVSQAFIQEPTLENAVAFNELASTLDLNNQKLRDFITNLNTNLSALNNNKAAIQELEGVLSELDLGVDVDFRPDAAQKKEEDRIQKDIKARTKAWEEEQRLQKERVAGLKDFTTSRLNILANAFGEESALGKAAFAANQALAIADAIMATELASAQALAAIPGPGGIALSGLIKGLGYASVGVIAGQTMASFEGGGFTGAGPRSGGIDGKGGKMAILHPNEKVMDLTKGAANDGGWQVIVNNNTSAEVTPQINEDQKIVSVMIDQVSRTTSPFMNAAQQSTNIRPRGSR